MKVSKNKREKDIMEMNIKKMDLSNTEDLIDIIKVIESLPFFLEVSKKEGKKLYKISKKLSKERKKIEDKCL
jgi:hypothetical protein